MLRRFTVNDGERAVDLTELLNRMTRNGRQDVWRKHTGALVLQHDQIEVPLTTLNQGLKEGRLKPMWDGAQELEYWVAI